MVYQPRVSQNYWGTRGIKEVQHSNLMVIARANKTYRGSRVSNESDDTTIKRPNRNGTRKGNSRNAPLGSSGDIEKAALSTRIKQGKAGVLHSAWRQVSTQVYWWPLSVRHPRWEVASSACAGQSNNHIISWRRSSVIRRGPWSPKWQCPTRELSPWRGSGQMLSGIVTVLKRDNKWALGKNA